VPLDPLEITAGLAIGTGLGGGIEDAVKPRLELFRQGQWQGHPDVALTPGVAAEVAAENYAAYQLMADEAARNGYNPERFQHLYDVTVTAPGMGELLNMLRRGTINPGNFTHGLRKAKLEPSWDNALADLANQKLPGPDIAYMVVRGVLPDAGMLGMALPTQADNLNLPPQLALDPVAEAALTGWDKERLRAFVGRSGLAMAPGLAAQARFRKILTQNDYELTIARGDLYPAFAAPVLEVSRQIPTVGEAVQWQLRGFTDRAGRLAYTQKHGMVDADSDVIYDVSGRAPAVHAIATGLARGAQYPGDYGMVPEPYKAAIQRSDIRPEFADIVYHDRFGYPSGFQIRAETQNGTLSQPQAEQILLEVGWAPKWATLFSTAWAGGTATGGDKHVAKAETQLWSTAHRSYVAEEIDGPTATTAIEAAGVTPASAPAVLALWGHERSLIRKQLSPAQIKKALKDGLMTQAEAMTALLARGYDQADATILLAE
jgi:hypothetical protein